jgi:hypothetical protein
MLEYEQRGAALSITLCTPLRDFHSFPFRSALFVPTSCRDPSTRFRSRMACLSLQKSIFSLAASLVFRIMSISVDKFGEAKSLSVETSNG